MKGLILAGGHGTRLRPITHTGPKQLIPIANKANILYCLEDIRDAGVTEIGIILGNIMPEKVQNFLGDGSSFGVKLTYIIQGEPKGIAHAIQCAREFMAGEPFVVYLGDNLIKGGIRALVDDFNESGAEAVVGLSRVPDPNRFGVAELDADGNIIGAEEKPKEPKSDLAIIGIYLFKESAFHIIDAQKPSWRNEIEVTDTIQGLIDAGFQIRSHVVTGWWKDTGKPEDILEANHLILDDLEPSNEGEVEEGVSMAGRVSIGKGTVVKSGCVIKGPTIIGKNCVIDKNAYIGPYTAVGDNTTISGGEIEACIIIGESKIECGKKIVNSLIGKGATISSKEGSLPRGHRFVIGENSIVSI